jgi:hypothetical protein
MAESKIAAGLKTYRVAATRPMRAPLQPKAHRSR